MCTLETMNKHYRVKVTCAECPKGRLLGRYGLIALVGEEMATKLIQRAERGKTDKITCKLRRGLRFDFYVK